MNARVSPWNLLMPFLILSDSHSLPHCLLPVTRVCLPCSANDSLVLSKRGGKYRWTLIVFYSESLSSGAAPTFLSPPNGSWCVVFAVDLCVGGALWFTELWHCLSSGTREADCGSLCVFQVSLRSAHHPCTQTHTHTHTHTCMHRVWATCPETHKWEHTDTLIHIHTQHLWLNRAGKLLLLQFLPCRLTWSTAGWEDLSCCPAGIEHITTLIKFKKHFSCIAVQHFFKNIKDDGQNMSTQHLMGKSGFKENQYLFFFFFNAAF